MTKHISYLIIAAAAAFASCTTEGIVEFQVENSCMKFHQLNSAFSMKGVTEGSKVVSIPIQLVGLVTDYDREINLEFINTESTTAEFGRDFRLAEPCILRAGELKTSIRLELDELPNDVETRTATIRIGGNEFFASNGPDNTCTITWSAEYARPGGYVWRAWFVYISQGYSKEYNKLLVDLFGEEIENSVASKGAAIDGLTYQVPQWWFAVNRKLVEYVTEYDLNHPGAPLMHSADYKFYRVSSLEPDEGTSPETIPTIASTLNKI